MTWTQLSQALSIQLLQSVRSVHLKLKSGEIFMVIDSSELNSESKMEDWI